MTEDLFAFEFATSKGPIRVVGPANLPVEELMEAADTLDRVFPLIAGPLAQCPMEGCVLWMRHGGQHMSRPYWTPALRRRLSRLAKKALSGTTVENIKSTDGD